MRLRGEDDEGYLERVLGALENDRNRWAQSSPAWEIAVAELGAQDFILFCRIARRREGR
jgi:hypothetical protein